MAFDCYLNAMLIVMCLTLLLRRRRCSLLCSAATAAAAVVVSVSRDSIETVSSGLFKCETNQIKKMMMMMRRKQIAMCACILYNNNNHLMWCFNDPKNEMNRLRFSSLHELICQ